MRWIGPLAVVLALSLGAGTAAAAGPDTIQSDGFAVSPQVRDLGQAGRAASGSSRTAAPGAVFEGTSNPTGCGGCTPPDTTGDVGPNNYVQVVNATKVAIFNKTGTLLRPAFSLSSLFPAGPCNPNDDGDPEALYDQQADRWVLAQFRDEGGPGPYHLCFAVSQTPDPLGAYFTYDFTTPEFPDYFKLGVWPSGYYVGSNESAYAAYAFDRAKMLAGDPSAGAVRFVGETNFLMPADVDGSRAPLAPTEGGFFYTFKDDGFHGGADRLELFQLVPNFANTAASTFTKVGTFTIAPFTYTVCEFFDLSCIPQQGTSQMVDAVSEWPMQRLAYRRFGDHESLVGNFTVGGGSATADLPPVPGAQIRWFELRRPSGTNGTSWSLFQEGTFDPGGGLNRFMGSIAIDVAGDISLGYSASSSSAFPSVRYATHLATDPPGTMGPEQVLQAGGGSQTSTGDRWGDYSSMSVDPADGCTFWYTNEFYPATATNAWHTAIGNYKEPSCADSDNDGIPDSGDACPATPNLQTANGCPPNDFTLGRPKVNKKKGTATVGVSVPGPGDVTLAGKNLKTQHAAPAAAGTATLKIAPKGKLKKQLKKKGKAKATAAITYTPTGGLGATESTKVNLKKKK